MMSRMIDPRDLANAIKELRGKRTQREVAKRARIDPATWNAYEKGIRTPRRPERLQQIAEGLGVDVAVLQNAILEQGARRLTNREPARMIEAESPEQTRPLQGPKDLNEICRLVEEQMAEISRQLTKLIFLLMEGRELHR